ncbi:hypothetical protein E2C01_087349 [Portunus trituberculatus]|uniref:Uncharacterized protein n=1 Tax=Portunus trituberculatus TaxID=210409 RepID=A0A5B7J6D1_PORTR|nr:hypothetical protein [Portunus trituberculatus]
MLGGKAVVWCRLDIHEAGKCARFGVLLEWRREGNESCREWLCVGNEVALVGRIAWLEGRVVIILRMYSFLQTFTS